MEVSMWPWCNKMYLKPTVNASTRFWMNFWTSSFVRYISSFLVFPECVSIPLFSKIFSHLSKACLSSYNKLSRIHFIENKLLSTRELTETNPPRPSQWTVRWRLLCAKEAPQRSERMKQIIMFAYAVFDFKIISLKKMRTRTQNIVNIVKILWAWIAPATKRREIDRQARKAPFLAIRTKTISSYERPEQVTICVQRQNEDINPSSFFLTNFMSLAGSMSSGGYSTSPWVTSIKCAETVTLRNGVIFQLILKLQW